jgi:DNA repair exonuclease SbcCD ATPase subunit
MKARDQVAISDGFDKNVAEKMPKIKKQEGFSLYEREPEPERQQEEGPPDPVPVEKEQERRPFLSPRSAPEKEKHLDVLKLIEDLHSQVLVSHQTRRALEADLSSSQKTVQQLVYDNNGLRAKVDDLSGELKRLKDIQAEATYLKEEHFDLLEKMKTFQQESRTMQEMLTKVIQERDELAGRAQDLQSQIEKTDVLRIKEKLREREASHFAEENKDLRSRLEELQVQNMNLEREYEEMRRSFGEVKESLTLLRDSCRAQYYNLSDNPD